MREMGLSIGLPVELFPPRARWPRQLALVREYEAEQEPTVAMLVAELRHDVDWVLVEGFKHDDVARIELRRQGDTRPARYPEDRRVQAVATDQREER